MEWSQKVFSQMEGQLWARGRPKTASWQDDRTQGRSESVACYGLRQASEYQHLVRLTVREKRGIRWEGKPDKPCLRNPCHYHVWTRRKDLRKKLGFFFLAFFMPNLKLGLIFSTRNSICSVTQLKTMKLQGVVLSLDDDRTHRWVLL